MSNNLVSIKAYRHRPFNELLCVTLTIGLF
jgi:hypothetical protein